MGQDVDHRTAALPERGDQRTVLVLEDDRDLGKLFVDWLSQEYVVRWARSCEQARELFDDSVDVALLDRMLPDGTGEDVSSWIRASETGCRVAMLTAVPAAEAKWSGFDAYLEKPISRDRFRLAVAELSGEQGC